MAGAAAAPVQARRRLRGRSGWRPLPASTDPPAWSRRRVAPSEAARKRGARGGGARTGNARDDTLVERRDVFGGAKPDDQVHMQRPAPLALVPEGVVFDVAEALVSVVEDVIAEERFDAEVARRGVRGQDCPPDAARRVAAVLAAAAHRIDGVANVDHRRRLGCHKERAIDQGLSLRESSGAVAGDGAAAGDVAGGPGLVEERRDVSVV